MAGRPHVSVTTSMSLCRISGNSGDREKRLTDHAFTTASLAAQRAARCRARCRNSATTPNANQTRRNTVDMVLSDKDLQLKWGDLKTPDKNDGSVTYGQAGDRGVLWWKHPEITLNRNLIDAGAMAVHGITNEFVADKPKFAEIVNDPDRLRHPLRRRPDGEFEQISWDTALEEIGRRLVEVHQKSGSDSIGWYFGNPATFSTGHTLWTAIFMNLLGTPHVYSAGSQDVNNRFVASHFLYGNPLTAPIPDINRVDYLVIVGANPVVSHGSVMSSPRIREGLNAITARGGSVVVVDPRHTETAREFDWLPITPDTATM